MTIPLIALNNGVEIPQLGYGTYKVPSAAARAATLAALETGYRHIDTAEMYGNEKEVGEAVRESGLKREQIFVTSKLDNGFHDYDKALGAFEQTLDTLDIDYLDLFLIHWPLPKVGDYVETWKAMEKMYESDRLRAIGVSNFQTHHLERLLRDTGIVPAVNQVEIHPYFINEDVRAFNASHGIVTEAWSPIGRGKVLDDPFIGRIAERVGRTPAQVVLRWHIQRGDVVFPKSVNPARVAENFALFDFELTDADIAEITAQNRDERTGSNPDA